MSYPRRRRRILTDAGLLAATVILIVLAIFAVVYLVKYLR
jgi:hypothetical protein